MFLIVNRANFSNAIPLNCLTVHRCDIFILLLQIEPASGPEPGPGEPAPPWRAPQHMSVRMNKAKVTRLLCWGVIPRHTQNGK